MTRKQAYIRLALIGLVTWAVGLVASGEILLGAVMAGVVVASGWLAIELGLSRRPPERTDDD
jgi:hypothetical protein